MKKVVLTLMVVGGIFAYSQTAKTDRIICPDSSVHCKYTYPDGMSVESEKGKDRGAVEESIQ